MKLSKSLSYVCRHGAVKLGIQMDSGSNNAIKMHCIENCTVGIYETLNLKVLL